MLLAALLAFASQTFDPATLAVPHQAVASSAVRFVRAAERTAPRAESAGQPVEEGGPERASPTEPAADGPETSSSEFVPPSPAKSKGGSFGSSSSSSGYAEPPPPPADALPLALLVDEINVVPHGTLAWDLDAKGRPCFVIAGLNQRLNLRVCDRELAPLETRVLSGLPKLDPWSEYTLETGRGLRVVALGAGRWWFSGRTVKCGPSVESAFPTVIYDWESDSLDVVDWAPWVANPADYALDSLVGDGRGGMVINLDRVGTSGRDGLLLSIGSDGRLRWSKELIHEFESRRENDDNEPVELLGVLPGGEILTQLQLGARVNVLDADGKLVRGFELAVFEDKRFPRWKPERVHGGGELLLSRKGAQASRRVFGLLNLTTGEIREYVGAHPPDAFDEESAAVLKSDGQLWRTDRAELSRVDSSGRQVERIADPNVDRYLARGAQLKWLADGGVLGYDPATGAAMRWSADGRVRAFEQNPFMKRATESATAMLDPNGTVWFTDAGGSSEGWGVAWSSAGEALTAHPWGAQMLIDPSGERVWAWGAASPPDGAAESSVLSLRDGEARVVQEWTGLAASDPTTATPEPVERAFRSLLAMHLAADGGARMWCMLEGTNTQVFARFSSDGRLVDALEQPMIRVGSNANACRGDRFLGRRLNEDLGGWIWEAVIFDFEDPHAPRYASIEELVPEGGVPAFSPDGKEIWCLFGEQRLVTKRAIGALEWKALYPSLPARASDLRKGAPAATGLVMLETEPHTAHLRHGSVAAWDVLPAIDGERGPRVARMLGSRSDGFARVLHTPGTSEPDGRGFDAMTFVDGLAPFELVYESRYTSPQETLRNWFALGGDRWLFANAKTRSEGRAFFAVFDGQTGRTDQLVGLENWLKLGTPSSWSRSSICRAAAGTPDGDFVMVVELSAGDAVLLRFDANFEPVWKQPLGAGFHEADVLTVLATGEVVVALAETSSIRVLNSAGSLMRKIELEVPYELSAVDEVHVARFAHVAPRKLLVAFDRADPDAELPESKGPLRLLDLDTFTLERFAGAPDLSARLEGGAGGALAIGPEGALWAQGAEGLVRYDLEAGALESLESPRLGAPSFAGIDMRFLPDGRVVCFDPLSWALAVWDTSGARTVYPRQRIEEPFGARTTFELDADGAIWAGRATGEGTPNKYAWMAGEKVLTGAVEFLGWTAQGVALDARTTEELRVEAGADGRTWHGFGEPFVGWLELRQGAERVARHETGWLRSLCADREGGVFAFTRERSTLGVISHFDEEGREVLKREWPSYLAFPRLLDARDGVLVASIAVVSKSSATIGRDFILVDLAAGRFAWLRAHAALGAVDAQLSADGKSLRTIDANLGAVVERELGELVWEEF